LDSLSETHTHQLSQLSADHDLKTKSLKLDCQALIEQAREEAQLRVTHTDALLKEKDLEVAGRLQEVRTGVRELVKIQLEGHLIK
jgi:hypothetical protein